MTMKKMMIVGSLLLPVALLSGAVVGDDEHDERGGLGGWFRESRLDVAPVRNETYREECGSCHFAYQPGLLPARSWERVMGSLDDHFGDNAEVDEPLRTELLDYLRGHSAETSGYKRSEGISRSLGESEAPRRITATRYFVHKHDEVPARHVTGNPKVGSFSNCGVCHSQADSGSYDEGEINIPGVGRWED